jgi:hypothetical protein
MVSIELGCQPNDWKTGFLLLWRQKIPFTPSHPDQVLGQAFPVQWMQGAVSLGTIRWVINLADHSPALTVVVNISTVLCFVVCCMIS